MRTPNQPPAPRAALTALLLLALGAPLLGCSDRRVTPPAIARDLLAAPSGDAPTLPLSAIPLATQADFDALEQRYLGRMSAESLVRILDALAEDADPAAHPEDVLLLQRTASLHLRAGEGAERLQQAFGLADRLREAAPDHPHTLYLLGLITQIILQQAPDKSFQLTPPQAEVASRLADTWARLLATDPEYLGPEGRGAEDIRRDLTALTAAIAALEAADGVEVGAPPAASARPASAAAQAAREALHRFEAGTPSQRLTVCRDHRLDHGDSPPETRVERWLQLRCAIRVGPPEAGVDALVALVQAGETLDACPWLSQLGPEAAALSPTLDAALRARGLAVCGATP